MKEDIYDIIARSLTGEKKPKNGDLEEWINEKPVNKTIFNSLKWHWLKTNEIPQTSKERTFQRISARIESKETQWHPDKNQRPFWEYFGKVAAVLLVAIGLVWAVFHQGEPDVRVSSPRIVKKTTSKGQKSTFTLGDGTIVKLNADSKIEFPSKFDLGKREVFLEGEAFFEVTRDEARPFVVYSGEIETTVLGTSFNVEAYPDQDKIKVALVSGKVEVRGTLHNANGGDAGITKRAILKPNEMATFLKGQNKITRKRFELEEITGWKDGVLVLKNANLEQIRKQLENWYGVDISYSNSRYEEGDITANYYNEPLENVLKSLGYTLRFEYSITGKDVEIKFLNLKNESI